MTASTTSPPPRAEAISDRTALLVALALVLAHSIAVVALMRQVQVTVDETTYYNSGKVIVKEGWDHPYTRLHGPIPYYVNQLFAPEFPPGGWQESDRAHELLFRGRLGTLAFVWLAAGVVFAWARRAFGNAGGVLAVGLYALHPLMLGYGGLLAVDVCHAGAVALALWAAWRVLERPSLAGAALAGLALGLSFATKYLAVLNGPIVALLVAARLAWTARERGAPAARAAGAGAAGAALVGAAAVLALHAAYGFRVGLAPGDPEAYRSGLISGLVGTPVVGPLLRAFPAPFLEGVDYQASVGEGGHLRPYLNGRFAPGHWDYYLWSFARKTPEWMALAMVAGMLVLGVRALRGRDVPLRQRATAWVVLPAVAVPALYLSLSTGLQIGVRYVLQLFPLGFVAAGSLATLPLVGALRARTLAAAGAALLALQAVELGRQWPNLIGYYNASSGGQSRGYRWFSDSNTDWGQYSATGLPWLAAHESEPFEELSLFAGPRFGRVVIGLRQLIVQDPEDPTRARHWLLALEPVRHVGGAYWLYDSQPAAWEAAVARSGDPRVRADLVVACLGAGRFEDAERHLAALPEDRAAPLLAVERAVRAAAAPGASVQDVLAGVEAWSDVHRHDLAEELLRSREDVRAWPTWPLLLAQQLVRQNRLLEAAGVLEGCSPESDHRIAFQLAELYRQLGRLEDAVLLLERVVPTFEDAERERLAERLADLREELDRKERFFASLGGPPEPRPGGIRH